MAAIYFQNIINLGRRKITNEGEEVYNLILRKFNVNNVYIERFCLQVVFVPQRFVVYRSKLTAHVRPVYRN